MDACLFCKIANKEIKSQSIYEDGDNFAFLDLHPVAPGHAMVISKTHSENILDLGDDKVQALFLAVKATAKKIKNSLEPAGFTIGINHGKASGQVVEHLHVHIIPRFENDGGKSIHSVVSNPPKESLEKLANLINKG